MCSVHRAGPAPKLPHVCSRLQVLEEVRLLLAPNASSVVAELDKLNVYGPGGFFKPHFDTPRSEGALFNIKRLNLS